MTLTIIGCYGAYPEPGGATSGYLLEEGETKVLLDCGSGVLARLQERLPLNTLDGVIVTHFHPDHCADLGCLQYAVMIDTQLGRRHKSFSAWGPGQVQTLNYLEYCQGYSYLETKSFRIGPLTFEVSENVHDIPSYAVKVTGKGSRALVYSGDTGYCEHLSAFTAGAECLLCEASFYKAYEARATHHLTAGQAGELAAAAGVRELILTHLPHFGEFGQLIIEAKETFNGMITLAEPWKNVSLETQDKKG